MHFSSLKLSIYSVEGNATGNVLFVTPHPKPRSEGATNSTHANADEHPSRRHSPVALDRHTVYYTPWHRVCVVPAVAT